MGIFEKPPSSRLGTNHTLKERVSKMLSEKDSLHQIVLFCIFCAVITFLILPKQKITSRNYEYGDIAQETIKSDGDYTVINEEATRLLIEEVTRAVPPVFVSKPNSVIYFRQAVNEFFATLAKYDGKSNEAEIAASLKNTITSVSDKSIKTLLNNPHNQNLKQALLSFARKNLEQQLVVGSLKNIQENESSGIEIQKLNEDGELNSEQLTDLSSVRDIPFLTSNISSLLLAEILEIQPKEVPQSSLEAIQDIATALLEPNLVFDTQSTADRRDQVSTSVNPVTTKIQKGETIIRDGDRVTSKNLFLLEALKKTKQQKNIFLLLFTRFILTVLFLTTILLFFRRFLYNFSPTMRDYYLTASLLVTTLLVIKGGSFIIQRVSTSFPNIPNDVFFYMLPVAAGAMVTKMVLRAETVVAFAIVTGLLVAAIFQFDFTIGTFAIMTSLYGAYTVARCETRTNLFKAAFFVGVFNSLIVLIFQLIPIQTPALSSLFFSFVSVLLVSSVMLFLMLSIAIPVVEQCGYITDMKLIELQNFNHPLLHRLAIEAPGTYHHSRVVAQLVEAAAAKVDANPLLALVQALYHDIGKTKAPQYFVENQDTSSRNIHDKLKPSMSRMIIVSHIKDGVEMAKRASLPAVIIDGIREHHGTSLIAFFYQKAKDQEDPDLDQIEESEYRYPGPKPRSKETGILLLADTVEATTKSLPDPTPEKIKGVIQRTFNKYFADGQLEECDLTLMDLNEIAKSFHRTLTSVYKPRVEYPETTQSGTTKAKKNDANRNNQPSKGGQNKQKDGNGDNREDIERLRLQ